MDVALHTRRLTLRPPTRRDVPNIARYLNDFAVVGNLSVVPHPYREEDAVAFVDMLAASPDSGHAVFALELPGHGLIGICGLHPAGSDTKLGYWLGQPFWNRGLMSEAATAAVDWFFSSTPAASLLSGAFAFNRASLAIQLKLGFTETGRGMLHCLARRQDLRHIDTQLTRTRWAELAAARLSQAMP